eukprot:sb/3460576/
MTVLVATQATDIICPPGVAVFSAHDDSQYYSCPVVGQVAVLESCQPGEVFDRVSETCVGLEKRSVAKDIINRPVIGEDVRLGTLFDARRGFLYSGFELYTKEHLENKKTTQDETGGKTNTFVSNDERSKFSQFGIGAEIALSIMSGQIKVKGSAEFFSKNRDSSNVARVIMSSEEITRSETLPISDDMDFDYCDLVKEGSGPTHVVTNVVYGKRAYLTFEKTAGSMTDVTALSGRLEAQVLIIPELSIGGHIAISINGTEYKNDDEMRVKFYGDTILESVPTTWFQAITTVNKALKDVPSSPIEFSLTPIQSYCSGEGAGPVIKSITASLVEKSIKILNDMESARQRLAALLESEAAVRYVAIKKQLSLVQAALIVFKTRYTASMANKITRIKAGQDEEKELVNLMSQYWESPFSNGRLNVFLQQREREVFAVTRIAADALSRTDIELADPVTATDNACIFKKQYATVFKLNILPESQNAENFLANTGGDWNEDDSWINSDYELYRIGQQKQAFEKYVDTNLVSVSGPRCYLVKLDRVDNNRKFEMRLYKSGQQITNTFVPPKRAPQHLTCSKRSADALELRMEKQNNPDVTGIRVIASSVTGQGVVRELPNADRVTLTGLEPGTVYELTAEYMVQDEHGVSPKTAPIHCSTRVISAPSTITVTKTTTNSIALSWSKPETIALALKDTSISYEVSVKGQVSKKLITNGLSMNISGLPAGSLYDVSIVAKLLQPSLTDPRSSPAKLAAITAPAAPTAPKVRKVTNNMAILEVDMSSVRVPKGASKDYLSVKYHQVDGKSGEKIAGTQTSFIQRVWVGGSINVFLGDLVKGTNYEATVRVLVRYDKTIVASPYSDPIAIRTSNTESPQERLRNDIDVLISDTDKRSDILEGSVKRHTLCVAHVVGKRRRGSPYGRANMRGATCPTLSASSTNCQLDGLEIYETGTPLYLSRNCDSYEKCLNLCYWKGDCQGVVYKPATKVCRSVKQRQGLVLYSAPGQVSWLEMTRPLSLDCKKMLYTLIFSIGNINLLCLLGGATLEGWDSCVNRDSRYAKDGVLATASGVSSPEECTKLCQLTNNCMAITHSGTSCRMMTWTKDKDLIKSNGSTSISLSCLQGSKQELFALCIHNAVFPCQRSRHKIWHVPRLLLIGEMRLFSTPKSFSNPNPAMPFCKAKRHPGGCLRHPPGQGKNQETYSLVILISFRPAVLVATQATNIICPPGITVFSAHDDSKYYSCPVVGQVAVLESCQTGEVFDRVSETCVGLEKRSVAKDIINRPVIGEDVRLGTLFDARRGFLYSGFELYSKEHLENKKITQDETGGKTNTFVSNDERSKFSQFGIGAEVALSIILWEPISDDMDFDYCDLVKEGSGPTHVVTNVVYGKRAYLVFEKTAGSQSEVTALSGRLEAQILIIPGMTIGGHIAISSNGTEYKNDDEMRVKFYGDTILESVPTTWFQAITTVNKALTDVPSSPIAFSLTPIQSYCSGEGAGPLIKSITASLVEKSIKILNDMESARQRLAALLESEAAVRYAAIKKQLSLVQAALIVFKTRYTASMANKITRIKAGQDEEKELVNLMSQYWESPFSNGRLNVFLQQREREVFAVTRIAADALSRADIELADPVTATDNACIFKKQYATVFKLNILPESQNAENFLANTGGDWNEDDSWINSDYELYRIGQQKQAFEKYVDTNLVSISGPRCYLVKLDRVDNNRKFEMRLYKSGKQITNTFVPPKRAPQHLTCSKRSADAVELRMEKQNNPDVTGIRVIASSVTGQGVVRELPNADRVTVTGLEPGTVYELTAEYMVQDEHGVSPKTAPIHCSTRVISAPSTITVTETTTNSIALSWSKPETITSALKDTSISYEVSVKGKVSKKLSTSGLSMTISGLPAGSLYDVSIVAKLLQPSLTDPRSSPAKLAAITAPAAPTAPKVKKVTNNMAILEVDMSSVRVPKGASKDYLSVKYHQVDGKSERTALILMKLCQNSLWCLIRSEKIFSAQILNLGFLGFLGFLAFMAAVPSI